MKISSKEIFEEIDNVTFDEASKHIANFESNFWLLNEKGSNNYSLGPRLTAQMESWLTLDPSVVRCKCNIIVMRGYFCKCNRIALHYNCRSMVGVLKCDNCGTNLKRFRTKTKEIEGGSKKVRVEKISGTTGLLNLGNTCYMNSVIQCLAKTPGLQKDFLSPDIRSNLVSEFAT